MNNIEFDVAEVLGYDHYDHTYNYIGPDQPKSNSSYLFAIKVRSINPFNKNAFLAVPSNINIKKIPLIGEYVLIYKTINSSTTSYNRAPQYWYYLSTVDLRSNVHGNISPGISDVVRVDNTDHSNDSPGKTFKLTKVSPLQPYEGDVVIEGRFGNSIRFSNTVDTGGNYYIRPNWSGNISTGSPDPIIILSNRQKNLPNKEFVTENIETDDSSIYLTTTQKLNTLRLHNVLNQSSDTENEFNKSQFISSADRIILKSKTDVVALDSNKSIELNSPLLSIGTKQDKDKEYGLHSTAVKELFDQFFYLLSLGGLKDSNGMPVTIDPAFTDKFFKLRNSLDNVKIRQDKGDE